MRKGFANSTSSSWNADASELTSFWPSKFSKVKLTLTRLTSSSDHSEWGCEGTPTNYSKDQAVFSAGAVPSQKYWNRLPAHRVLSPSVSISTLLPQTIYVFPYPRSPTILCGYCWSSWPFLQLINRINKLIQLQMYQCPQYLN